VSSKGKVIPLHAIEAHGVRGGIAPTHSKPRHYSVKYRTEFHNFVGMDYFPKKTSHILILNFLE
jgi:hypothetical protein